MGVWCRPVIRVLPIEFIGGAHEMLLRAPDASLYYRTRSTLRMKYLPNALTIIRILVTPVILVLLFSETLTGRLWALGLFIAASVSDYLDGKLARQFMVRSKLGHMLDPIADKVLVLGTFAALALIIPDLVPWWAVALIAVRALAVTLLRTHARRRGITLRTLNVGKAKTAVQLTFLIAVLTVLAAEKMPGLLGRWADVILDTPVVYGLAVVTALVTVYTGLVYFINREEEDDAHDGA